jgi:hypothetical protein
MYDNERSNGLNIRSLIGKIIFIIIFVLLMIWLLPKVPNMTPFYSNVFRENISYMQEAAESHFTNERLPQNLNEEVKLTLQEMINQNLIIPFVDKNGNSCDESRSYVSVTKNSNDYTLKINLICDDEEKYIVETLGCYDKCGDSCTKEETALEYQFKKSSKKTTTSCSCPSGYVDKDGSCYKSIISSKIDAKPVKESDSYYIYKANKIENKIPGKVIVTEGSSYDSCPTGFNPIGNGKCGKSPDTTVDKTYKCPSGYTHISGSGANMVCQANQEKCGSCQPYTAAEKSKLGSSYEYCGKTDMVPSCTNGNCVGYVLVYYYQSCGKDTTGPNLISSNEDYCKQGDLINGLCVVDAVTKTTGKTSDCETGFTKAIVDGNTTCYKISYESKCEKAEDLLNGDTCSRLIIGKFKYYECPQNEGYVPDGAFCYKVTDDTKKLSCSTTTKTAYSYKWARTKTLSGWTATGKTREVKVN